MSVDEKMAGLRGAVYTELANKALWEQVHNIFLLFDEDGSGFLDLAEVHHGVERFGKKMSDEELQGMFDQVGAGKEGLSKLQFMSLLAKIMALKTNNSPSMTGLRGAVYTELANKALWEQVHNIFLLFDEDGSGFLDLAEVRHGVERFGKKMSDEELQGMFDEIGAGKEGLSKLQFMSLLAKIMALKEQQKLHAGFRAEVYEKYAHYSVSAIREASTAEASGSIRSLLERRAADLPAIPPNQYKSLPEGFAPNI